MKPKSRRVTVRRAGAAATARVQGLKGVLPGRKGRRVVLAGGCFDILHIGHVRFLSEARAMGDYLVVLLESDQRVKALKGEKRPVFVQKERAETLSALRSIDLVVMLPAMETDGRYLNLIKRIKPAVIAATENDPLLELKRRQAAEVGSELRIVPLTKTVSSSQLAGILGAE